MIAIALVAACGGEPEDTGRDAGSVPVDAAPVDAAVPEIPIAWLVEVPETITLDEALLVGDGLVLVGLTEALRFSSTGELLIRRPLPLEWGDRQYAATPDGDVLITASTIEPVSTFLIRLDGTTLEERWTFVIDDGGQHAAAPVGRADGSTLAVTESLDGARRHGLTVIDADGKGTHTELDVPEGGSNGWFLRADGQLSGALSYDECRRWLLDPETRLSTFQTLGDPTCQDAHITSASGLELLWYARVVEPYVHALDISDPTGTVITSTRTRPFGSNFRGASVMDGSILTMSNGGSIRRSSLDELDTQEKLTLPYRPGAWAEDAVIVGDGERTFLAWLDSLGTFDTVLRVARVGEIE